jgi:hypothetical protein
MKGDCLAADAAAFERNGDFFVSGVSGTRIVAALDEVGSVPCDGVRDLGARAFGGGFSFRESQNSLKLVEVEVGVAGLCEEADGCCDC